MEGDPSATAVAAELLAGIRERDIERIRACFAPDALLRALTPHQLREDEGRDAIAERYRFWLTPLDPYELLAADLERVADRVRIRYRFRGEDPVNGWQENEHTGYVAVEDGLITSINTSCAGFRPAEHH